MFKGLKKIKTKLKMPKFGMGKIKIPKIKSPIKKAPKIKKMPAIKKMNYGIKTPKIQPIGKLSQAGKDLKY